MWKRNYYKLLDSFIVSETQKEKIYQTQQTRIFYILKLCLYWRPYAILRAILRDMLLYIDNCDGVLDFYEYSADLQLTVIFKGDVE